MTKAEAKGASATSVYPEIERFSSMIRSLALSMTSQYYSTEELESAAWQGAERAFRSYDKGRGAELSSWIYAKARFAICDMIRRDRKRRERVKLGDEAFLTTQAQRSAPNDNSCDEEDTAARDESVAEATLSLLDARTREIVTRICIGGETRAAVARDFGISSNWCGKLYNRGLAKMKTLIERAREE